MKVEPFDTQRHMTFTRRAALASGGVFLLFGGIAGRLYDLQVRRYQEFAAKADDNRFKQRIVVPLRGEIVDRYGNTMASNRQNFRVLLVPEQTKSVTESIARLQAHIPLTEAQQERLLKEVRDKRNQPFVPIEVIDNLTWDQFVAVNFEATNLPGIVSDVGHTRYYPDGEVVAPIVGHVGSADTRDLANAEDQNEKLLYLQPGFKLGKLGLEYSHDTELRGEAGSQTVEVTAAGRVIEENENRGHAAEQGDALGLTIDADLQRAAHDILAADYEEYPEGTDEPYPVTASAVVMDVVTGDIIVMASTPAFDPNLFARRVEAQTLRELKESPTKPLLCKPLAGAYPPGSTFKLLTGVAAQENGIDADTRFYCGGSFRFGSHSHSCWKRSGHGSMNLSDAIKNSCDVYFYNVATRVDIDHIADVARRFGLGQTYDLGISGEVRGTVPDRDWKRAYYRTQPANQMWFPGETLSVAIGQGAVTSTPLQLAVMSARLATGQDVMPRIVRGVGKELQPTNAFGAVGIDAGHLDVIRAGMDRVVNEWGTAARSSLKPDWRMAGKTGTSQVRSLQINPKTGRPFGNEELPWHQRDHALFVAFAPFESPRYAISVVVEHGGSGSKSAGPRARDIMRAVLEKDPANTSRHPLWVPGAPRPRQQVASANLGG
ncbi:penicillin-binding protein 2 [Parvularcula sp. LCG005]|uniref:penicillin-binding protein 2 n=1 Tax=Parvularcula sp. LCG005 TaxID=3078805 RepID=UPI0029421AE5|nr:penicillin-binding protein 2 [Parvularcula sp. LCG005]WOI54117.1 penicillin-binding protein 2 [Parvularcula sp. LCG005]